MAGAECNDLLLGLLEHRLGIVPHTDVLFHCFILFRGNKHLFVLTEAQTPGNPAGIDEIALLCFVVGGSCHCGWSHDDTLHAEIFPLVGHDLFVQRISQASGFIAADEVTAAAQNLIQVCQILLEFLKLRTDLQFKERSLCLQGEGA